MKHTLLRNLAPLYAAILAALAGGVALGVNEVTTGGNEPRPEGLVFLSRWERPHPLGKAVRPPVQKEDKKPPTDKKTETPPADPVPITQEFEQTISWEGPVPDIDSISLAAARTGMDVKLLSFEVEPEEEVEASYVASIKFDMTTSMQINDGSKKRFDAAEAQIKKLSSGAKVAVGALSGDLTSSSEFKSPSDALADLAGLREESNGYQTAFATMLQEVDLLATRSEKDKSLVMLSDFDDGLDPDSADGSAKIADIISHAKAAGVRIYLVKFRAEADGKEQTAAASIATETGGAMYDAATADELGAAFAKVGSQMPARHKAKTDTPAQPSPRPRQERPSPFPFPPERDFNVD